MHLSIFCVVENDTEGFIMEKKYVSSGLTGFLHKKALDALMLTPYADKVAPNVLAAYFTCGAVMLVISLPAILLVSLASIAHHCEVSAVYVFAQLSLVVCATGGFCIFLRAKIRAKNYRITHQKASLRRNHHGNQGNQPAKSGRQSACHH